MKEKIKLILCGFYLIGFTIITVLLFDYVWNKYNNDQFIKFITLSFAFSLLLCIYIITWNRLATEFNKRNKSKLLSQTKEVRK